MSCASREQHHTDEMIHSRISRFISLLGTMRISGARFERLTEKQFYFRRVVRYVRIYIEDDLKKNNLGFDFHYRLSKETGIDLYHCNSIMDMMRHDDEMLTSLTSLANRCRDRIVGDSVSGLSKKDKYFILSKNSLGLFAYLYSCGFVDSFPDLKEEFLSFFTMASMLVDADSSSFTRDYADFCANREAMAHEASLKLKRRFHLFRRLALDGVVSFIRHEAKRILNVDEPTFHDYAIVRTLAAFCGINKATIKKYGEIRYRGYSPERAMFMSSADLIGSTYGGSLDMFLDSVHGVDEMDGMDDFIRRIGVYNNMFKGFYRECGCKYGSENLP